MDPQQIMLGLAGFFHNLFTVIWVGGLVMMAITLLPATGEVLGKGQQMRDLLKGVLRRHRIWVYISIVGLFVTGLIQTRAEPAFSGLFHFDTLYSALTSIKHLLTFVMIGIALFRSLALDKKLENADPKQMKRSMQLILINASLGVAVLLLSGLTSAL